MAQLDGFDISPVQFPHTVWLPKNVTLDSLDILKPLPAHLRGEFDIVHVGLLVLVVENDDPLLVLDNLLAMLSMLTAAWLLNTVETDSLQDPVATYSGMRAILVAFEQIPQISKFRTRRSTTLKARCTRY